jgi:haloalkane dehalogenase
MKRRKFFRVGAAAAAFAAWDRTSGAAIWSEGWPCKEMTPAQFHAARKFAVTEQGRIAYLDIGDGPTALFLHGFPLNSFQWRGVIPILSMIRRCVAPDFLALGYTEVAAGQSVAPQAQVAMLVQLLDKLSLSKVDIVASDTGGTIGQLFVTRYPDRVNSLLLTNCDTERNSPPQAVLPVIELGRAGRFADEWIGGWMADKDLARSDKGLGGQCYMEPVRLSDETIETYLAPLVKSATRKSLTNAYAAALAPNPLLGIESLLKHCYVATRILWGTGDTIFSLADAEYLARTVGNSLGARSIPGAKLFFQEELPEVIVEEARFLWSL